jgi:mannose-1-phosphate guanylyltransferase/mannose-6-phosphate isomerase
VGNEDPDDNVTQGNVITKGACNSLIYSQSRLVAALGIKDLVVVETTDAVLVAHMNCTQDINTISDHLRQKGRPEHAFHQKVHRPWGNFESLNQGPGYQVKRLTVAPGAPLSLQIHHHRAEHWVVVKSTARVTRGDKTFLLGENQSTYIPLGTTHRLENPGSLTLEIIKVQSGDYIGEDDIVRFDDDYDRVDPTH